MSRIGKMPIDIPPGVDIQVDNGIVKVKGSKGELTWAYPDLMKIVKEDKTLTVVREGETKKEKALHGLTRKLIYNMVSGVSSGFKRELELVGVGYRAQVKGDVVEFSVGYSHPVVYNLPTGVTAEIDKKQTKLTLSGIDKQLLGQIAANMRGIRPPDSYKGKGIRYANEKIKLKPGKAGGK